MVKSSENKSKPSKSFKEPNIPAHSVERTPLKEQLSESGTAEDAEEILLEELGNSRKYLTTFILFIQ